MNPILAKLERELQQEKERSLDVSYNIRLSRQHITVLQQTSEQLNVKQSELLRAAILNLPDLLKK